MRSRNRLQAAGNQCSSEWKLSEANSARFISGFGTAAPGLCVSSFTLSIHLTSSVSVCVTGHTWNPRRGWWSRFPWQAGAVKKTDRKKKITIIVKKKRDVVCQLISVSSLILNRDSCSSISNISSASSCWTHNYRLLSFKGQFGSFTCPAYNKCPLPKTLVRLCWVKLKRK